MAAYAFYAPAAAVGAFVPLLLARRLGRALAGFAVVWLHNLRSYTVRQESSDFATKRWGGFGLCGKAKFGQLTDTAMRDAGHPQPLQTLERFLLPFMAVDQHFDFAGLDAVKPALDPRQRSPLPHVANDGEAAQMLDLQFNILGRQHFQLLIAGELLLLGDPVGDRLGAAGDADDVVATKDQRIAPDIPPAIGKFAF